VVRVVLVDDQALVREGLELVLGMLPGIKVAGSAADAAAALAIVERERPDVVLMDLRMPGVDGIEATRRIGAAHPQIPVLALTTYADDASIVAALEAGARGYLTKNARGPQLGEAIAAVLGGGSYFDQAVQQRLAVLATAPKQHGLTKRELDVLRLIAGGRSNAEIAEQLVVTEGTVKTHINNLFAKAGVRDRAQAVAYAYRHGIVSPPTGG
jgi:DNA-binding NarL/FixJ family response regulator